MPLSEAPYPGLRPFGRGETDIFFGREGQTDCLVDRLARSRFLAVVGPSGSGKSSLVRAGLIDALESGFMAVAGADWRVADMRPGGQPMRHLAEALLAMSGRLRYEHDSAFLQATLERGPRSLIDVLKEQLQGQNLLLLVDQFEEMFRFATEPQQEQADTFVTQLLSAAAQRDLPVYVVITMRSDFIGDCARFPGLPEAVSASQFLTPRMTREQSREAIEGPARVFGGQVEPALANRMLNDLGTDPDQLPLMQHALMRMWSRVTQASADQTSAVVTLGVDDYKHIGGMDKALSNHVNEAYDALDHRDKPIAESLFRVITERATDQRDIRRPKPLADIVRIVSDTLARRDVNAGVERVLDAFRRRDRSFIMPPEGVALEDTTVIDISHESLIRQWDRLKRWVEQEAEAAQTYRELLPPATRWRAKREGFLAGLGGLWRGPDLGRAVTWKGQTGAAWAALYGGDFDAVTGFVESSRRVDLLRKTAYTLLVILTIGAVIAFQQQRLGFQEQLTVNAERGERERTVGLFEAQLTHATLLARIEDYAQTTDLLEKTRPLDTQVPVADRQARNLLARFARIMGGAAQRVYQGLGLRLLCVAVSPDGHWLAAGAENGTVLLYDAQSGALQQQLQEHNGAVWDIAFDPQGAWLISAGEDQRIIRWSLPTPTEPAQQLQAWGSPGPVQSLAIQPDGAVIASGDTDGNISLWEATTGDPVRRLEGHSDRIAEGNGLTFDSTGQRLASASYDGTARLWDVQTGASLRVLKDHTGHVLGVAFSADGELIATSGQDKRVVLWSVDGELPVRIFNGHQNHVFGVGFVARPSGGLLLVSGSEDRTLRIWDVASGVTLRILQGHGAGVLGFQLQTQPGPGSNAQVITSSNDGTIRRWDVAPLPHQRLIELPGSAISTAISPTGRTIAIGFADGAVRLYGLADFALLAELPKAHSDTVIRLAFSADGKTLASAGLSDHNVAVWTVAANGTLASVQTIKGHTNPAPGLSFAPDGKSLAIAGYDGRVGLFTLGTQQHRFIDSHDKKVAAVAFDQSGARLFSAGNTDQSIKEWDLTVEPARLIQMREDPQGPFGWATFGPHRPSMVSGGHDTLVRVYPVDNTGQPRPLVGHQQTVFRARFGPDGNQLASVSADETVRMWDLRTATELFTLRLPAQGRNSLYDFDFRCTPAGCWIAVPLTSGKLALYELGDIAG